jgi:hypothetical protein
MALSTLISRGYRVKVLGTIIVRNFGKWQLYPNRETVHRELGRPPVPDYSTTVTVASSLRLNTARNPSVSPCDFDLSALPVVMTWITIVRSIIVTRTYRRHFTNKVQ